MFLLWCIWLSVIFTSHANAFEPLEAVFYEEKPYIYTEGNVLKGMFKEYFDSLARDMCIKTLRQPNTVLIKYQLNLGSGHRHPKSYQPNRNTIIFPYLANDKVNNLTTVMGEPIEVFSSKGLAVVVRRHYISFVSKFKRAFYAMETSAIMLVVAVAVGIILWVIVSL